MSRVRGGDYVSDVYPDDFPIRCDDIEDFPVEEKATEDFLSSLYEINNSEQQCDEVIQQVVSEHVIDESPVMIDFEVDMEKVLDVNPQIFIDLNPDILVAGNSSPVQKTQEDLSPEFIQNKLNNLPKIYVSLKDGLIYTQGMRGQPPKFLAINHCLEDNFKLTEDIIIIYGVLATAMELKAKIGEVITDLKFNKLKANEDDRKVLALRISGMIK